MALLAVGIPAGGFKGDQDLDGGQSQGEGSSSPCGLDSARTDDGGGVSGTRSPLVPSTGTSQGHLQTPGDKTVRKVGVVCGKSAIWAAQKDRGERSE